MKNDEGNMWKWAFFPFVLLAAGCGPALVPVEGTVTLDEKPLAGALVSFIPVKGGFAISGQTDGQGRFHLNSPKGEGAPPGAYKVTVSKKVALEGAEMPADSTQMGAGPKQKELLPKQFANAEKTSLQYVIPKSGMKDIFIEIQTEKKTPPKP